MPTEPQSHHHQPEEQRHPEPRILPMVPPRGLLESIVDEVQAQRRHATAGAQQECAVLLDVADRHVLQVDPKAIREILAALITSAVANAALTPPSEMPSAPEVVVTSIEYADAIEIEIADSGPQLLPAIATATVAPTIQALLDQVGGRLTAANCAEGGRALTLRLPHRRLRRMAA